MMLYEPYVDPSSFNPFSEVFNNLNSVMPDDDDNWSFYNWLENEVVNNVSVNEDNILFPKTQTDFTHPSNRYLSGDFINDTEDSSTQSSNDSYISYSGQSNYLEAVQQRRPGRPRATSKKICEHKIGKLWEFLRNLLLDSRTCPSLIKWDNYIEGTFKFVQSEKVAQLWGNRKNNKKMNYEKLSRAMRYYYRSQVLLPVAGRRLVYKFGPQATGWRTDNPIL